jgi:hypothetical protein
LSQGDNITTSQIFFSFPLRVELPQREPLEVEDNQDVLFFDAPSLRTDNFTLTEEELEEWMESPPAYSR